MTNLDISQDDANKLLQLASEFVVALRASGYHLTDTLTDADTGKPVEGETLFQELQKIIRIIRHRDQYGPSVYDAAPGGFF